MSFCLIGHPWCLDDWALTSPCIYTESPEKDEDWDDGHNPSDPHDAAHSVVLPKCWAPFWDLGICSHFNPHDHLVQLTQLSSFDQWAREETLRGWGTLPGSQSWSVLTRIWWRWCDFRTWTMYFHPETINQDTEGAGNETWGAPEYFFFFFWRSLGKEVAFTVTLRAELITGAPTQGQSGGDGGQQPCG